MIERTEMDTTAAASSVTGNKKLRSSFRRGTTYSATVLSVGVIVVFLAVWQVFSSFRIVDPFFISSPWLVLQRLVQFFLHGVGSLGQLGPQDSIWYNIGVTLEESIIGFGLGVVLGVLVGLILSQSKLLASALLPILNMLNTLPRVALAPLFIVWFGLGLNSKVILVVTVVIFIMIFNTYSGAQSVDPELISTLRLLGAKRLDLIRKLILPSSLPWIFSGMRISLAWSIGSAVIAEYIGAKAGLGYLVFNFANDLDNTGLLAGCVVLLIVSFILFALLGIVERIIMKPRARAAH